MSKQAQQAIGGVLTYIALGLIIAAQTNRFWLVSSLTSGSTTVSRTEYGLYQQCLEISGLTTCGYYTWTPEFSGEGLTAFVTRVVLIAADALLGIAFITSFIAFCLKDKSRRNCLLTTGILNIIGGFLVVIAAIAYIALALSQFLLSSLTSTVSRSYYFGFCYGFCWAAGVLFIIGGVLQITGSKKDRTMVQPSEPIVWTTSQYVNPYQQTYPVSTTTLSSGVQTQQQYY